MNILFIHDNYPAQFGAFGAWLEERGWRPRYATAWNGAKAGDPRFIRYKPHREPAKGVHPFAYYHEKAAINAQSAAQQMVHEAERGYAPDIVMAHSGWGAGLFARDIWPAAKFVPYLEWWYRSPAPDEAFLGRKPGDLNARLRQRTRNIPFLLDMTDADLALCPTEFQAAQFPRDLRARLTVIHDGVDAALHAPARTPPRQAAGLDLTAMPEIVTSVTRGMEPHRGFPQLMRALAQLQQRRPGLHAIIGGEDRVAYGAPLPGGESWKRRMLDEQKGKLDPDRVHFVGLQPRREYVRLLQASHAHVYLTTDFVLSWSLLEAMAVGCPLVVSSNPPVAEFMTDRETGLFCDFHDPRDIAARIAEALDGRAAMAARGAAARARITERHSTEVLYPRKKALLEALFA